MNVDELRGALAAMADEVGDDQAARLQSIDRRVRVNRRKKIASTVAAACVVAAAFAVVPHVHWPTTNSGQPAIATFGSMHVEHHRGVLVYSDAAGARLLGEKTGAVGDTSVSVIVTSTSGNLGWTQFCSSPKGAAVTYHLAVNGRSVPAAVLEELRYSGVTTFSRTNARCDDASQQPMQVQRSLGLSPQANIKAWHALGVHPDLPATITLSATAAHGPAGTAALRGTQLSLGVFQKPMHPGEARGLWIDKHITDPPAARGSFALVAKQFDKVSPGRTALTISLPDSTHQLYVRTFVLRGQGSGVVLQRPTPALASRAPGSTTSREPAVHSTRWQVDQLVTPGAQSIQTGVAVVPAGVHRVVCTLVYERYE